MWWLVKFKDIFFQIKCFDTEFVYMDVDFWRNSNKFIDNVFRACLKLQLKILFV